MAHPRDSKAHCNAGTVGSKVPQAPDALPAGSDQSPTPQQEAAIPLADDDTSHLSDKRHARYSPDPDHPARKRK